MNKRVVVTGYGLVSPIGNSVKQSWTNLINGKSGIQSYHNDEVLKNQTPYNLALVKNFQYAKWKVPHANNRMNSFLHSATDQAINNSKINITNLNKQRAGICIGNMASSNSKLLQYISQSMNNNFKTINRLSMLQVLTNIPSATLNVKYQFQGPSLCVSSACATGLSAIIEGFKWIKLNQADFVITGATEDVYNPLYLNSSLRLQAMSSKVYQTPQKSCCPFDKSRSGFILGEGSGVVILQSLDHALDRKANILAQIVGYGYTSDGHSLVRPKAQGKNQKRSMELAMNMANWKKQEVDHVNTHATSTLAGDQIQANSIKDIFGEKPSISALKSSIGHTFGSAGVIQTIFGLKSLQQNLAPKILNLQNPDVGGLNYATQNKQHDIKKIIKNSFGFGGINVSLALQKYK